MADDAAAQVQPTTTTAAPPAPPAPAAPEIGNRGAARAERRAAAVARLQGTRATEQPSAAAPEPKPAPAAAAAAPAVKPAEVPAEKHDPVTERGLRAVEQSRKKFLDEQNASKAELEVQRAEIARLRKEAEGGVASVKELQGLKPKELIAAMKHYSASDWDAMSRMSYALTDTGKADPRAAAAAEDARRALDGRAAHDEVSQLKATVEELRAELRGEFTRRDQASFAERWVGEAVKAIPADKPSFVSKLYANEPDTARRELLAIGAELEKANDGEPPTHAEVLAEFETRKRASLKAMGLDPDALLAPPKPAPPVAAKPVGRTLDVTAAANVTRPENAPKTREEKRAVALSNLRARQRATADQLP